MIFPFDKSWDNIPFKWHKTKQLYSLLYTLSNITYTNVIKYITCILTFKSTLPKYKMTDSPGATFHSLFQYDVGALWELRRQKKKRQESKLMTSCQWHRRQSERFLRRVTVLKWQVGLVAFTSRLPVLLKSPLTAALSEDDAEHKTGTPEAPTFCLTSEWRGMNVFRETPV